MKNKLLKTVFYRITASALAQGISWILFSKIEVNAVVLSVDLIQMVYYFIFESIWCINKKELVLLEKRFDTTIKTLLACHKYSEKAIKEICQWYII
jgi:uncharacterized membrane protein